ncbi:MAG: hypothetical protein DMG22_08710 [Acidobacteria bacterium]|nr:MAG: hypothetical protein DMG22_08710 [Acidobacteriota bacterium]
MGLRMTATKAFFSVLLGQPLPPLFWLSPIRRDSTRNSSGAQRVRLRADRIEMSYTPVRHPSAEVSL